MASSMSILDIGRLLQRLTLALSISLLVSATAQAQTAAQPASDDEAIHTQLRALKDRAMAAINHRDIDAVLAEADPKVVLTTMDNNVARGRDAVHAYFDKMMTGDHRIVQDLEASFEPDDLSVIYGGDNAVATGWSKAHLKLMSGLELDIAGRWTADLVKENDKWLISAFHYSVDMFDNPLLNAATRTAWYAGIGALLAGLAAGFFFGRRRTR